MLTRIFEGLSVQMSIHESICPSVHPHVSLFIWSRTSQLVHLLIHPSIKFWSRHFFKSPSNMIRSCLINYNIFGFYWTEPTTQPTTPSVDSDVLEKTTCMSTVIVGKKSKLLRFLESWGRNPVFQFLLGTFWGSCGNSITKWDLRWNW